MLKAEVKQDAEVPLASPSHHLASVRNVNAKIYYIVVLRREEGGELLCQALGGREGVRMMVITGHSLCLNLRRRSRRCCTYVIRASTPQTRSEERASKKEDTFWAWDHRLYALSAKNFPPV